MRFHIDWGEALHAMLPFQINAPPPQNDGIAEDSAMITAVYEAHLSKEKMLAALAELRGDDAGHIVG